VNRHETNTIGKPFDPNHYPWEKAAGHQPAQEETAGHKRDLPAQEVITAAESKVKTADAPVKQVEPSKSTSQSGWVDYAWLRQQITLQQVLQQVGCLDELSKRGSQRRARCPVHTQAGDRNRSFSADLKKNVFQCFDPSCGIHGNVLDFWAAWRRLPLPDAAETREVLSNVRKFVIKNHAFKRRCATRTAKIPSATEYAQLAAADAQLSMLWSIQRTILGGDATDLGSDTLSLRFKQKR